MKLYKLFLFASATVHFSNKMLGQKSILITWYFINSLIFINGKRKLSIFFNLMSGACIVFLREQSLPKRNGGDENIKVSSC